MKRLLMVAAVMALGGCALDRQGAPALSGPSEFGLSLEVTATPDIVTWDGFSQATVSVLARDPNNQPVRGLSMRLDMSTADGVIDFGTLGTKTISTNNDGRASVVYVAPPSPGLGGPSSTRVIILITPVGTNYQNANTRSVEIRLAKPGVILGPNGAPVPDFVFSPAKPHENETILFDASASKDDGQIASYVWSFGDGGGSAGPSPTHSYAVAGDYVVTLTVTDDRGLSSSIRKTVTVTAEENPSANFTFSPTGVKVGQNVIFNASSSTVPPGRDIIAYNWEFGDGGSGGGQIANHTFGAAGTYTVTLTVIDSTGRKSVKSTTVSVTP